MGVVYRAYHAQLERECAVKVLQAIGADPDSTARFRREAQAIARMRHPNVLNVFDFGEFEGTPYMIVEYVPGGSLAPRMRSGPLSAEAALTYLHGIADALDYAHKHGIVHRDVKPANVLLGPDDNPILADFGLAKLMESSSIKSLTGVTTGTPAYMAPEQVTGSQVGPAADRYSLAVIAYQMLTGSLPFEEGGVLEVMYAQVHKEPAPPSMLDHTLPAKVDGVILRGMAKEPSARWERCNDFVGALESALKATAPAPVERTVAFAPPPPAETKPKPAPRPAQHKLDVTTVMQPAAADGPIRGPDPALPHPIATWGGFAVPGVAKPKRFPWGRVLVVMAVVLVVALLAATVAYLATRPPDVSLSSYNVRAGDRITVMATHLPPDQEAEVQLLSDLLIFPIRSDSFGRATRQVDIPLDIDGGDHTIRVCWNGTCPVSTTLHVRAVPQPTPSPIESPSPTPVINVAPSSGIVPGKTVITVDGSNFTPNRAVVIYVVENGTPSQVSSSIAGPAGNFTRRFTLPAKTPTGSAAITACDAANHCGSAPITIGA